MRLLSLLGPVFAYEWLMTSRRWQMYALRAAFVALLGGALTVVWLRYGLGSVQTMRSLGDTGEFFFYALVGTQFVVVLLVAPAATAGSITSDLARGNLLQLLATDLSSTEIVLGKLAARLMPVLGLLFCSLPVLFAAVLLGGIAPAAIVGAYAVTAGIAVLGCTLAIFLSLWGAKTHEVLLANYFIWSLFLLLPLIWLGVQPLWGLPPLPFDIDDIDPLHMALHPYLRPGASCLLEQLLYLVACVTIAVVLVVFTIRQLRPAVLRHASRSIQAPRRYGWTFDWPRFPGPSLEGNPVLWREWHRQRPSRWFRMFRLVYILMAVLFTGLAILECYGTTGRHMMPRLVNAFQVAIGLLLVCVTAVTTLAEERARGSLDVLLVTPLSTRTILSGKWWGAFRSVLGVALLPVLLGAACAWQSEHWLAVCVLAAMILTFGAAITSLGLFLATRLRRTGWALAVCVGSYLFVTLGWIPMLMLFVSGKQEVTASFSPFLSIAVLTVCCEDDSWGNDIYGYALTWNVAWLVFYAFLSVVLLRWTRRCFNRCLGRMDEAVDTTAPTRTDR